ncbi:MAG: type IV pilus assembly protein PilM [Patescibacteria group bacterium]|nr:type IV pilus assembly protein PilM [bacterium]MDZ4240914.1 type IV pilus assembly protein PilM [Patescibacteria group bacterium]
MASFLKKFKNLFGQTQKSVIGIDIGSSAIKIVQLSQKGNKAMLDTYGALALGPYAGLEIGRATNLPVEKVVEALNDVIKEAGITNRRCGIAIPFSASLLTVVPMPAVPDAQLAGMIPIEARKYIPVPISEVTLDWSVIPDSSYALEEPVSANAQKPVGGMRDVLIVAIHNESIAKYQDIVKKGLLNASFFEIEIFSTMRSSLDQETTPVMIFDMGAALTKLYIVEKGVIRSSHTINRGSQDVTLAISKALAVPMDKAEVLKRDPNLGGNSDNREVMEAVSLILDYVFSEASRVLYAYQKKYSKNISKIVLVGGGVGLSGFKDRAHKAFQSEIVSGDPFSKVEAPAFLDGVLKTVGPEFAVAVGVALRRLQEFE